ncbi:hypothetical protein L218DRAFT_871237 [Marasmius fiardii PR-910]|nr:hypothetical protein L218DRAFT_871237 [Marasmius fiardii PR-910]
MFLPALPLGRLLLLFSTFQLPWVKGDSVLFESNEYTTGILGDAPFQSYFSVDYTPAEWNVVVPWNRSGSRDSERGYIFLAPRGANIAQYGAVMYDESGSVVWSAQEYGEAMAFSVVQYKGEPHIILWQGQWTSLGIGFGYNLLFNKNYEVVANYTTNLDGDTGKTYADFHEAQITSNNTGLMDAYQYRIMDLSSYGGPSSGWILDGVAQEVDIETGNALWTWKASDHVDPGDCYNPLGDGGTSIDNAWDYFHINSIEKDDNGNFLVSSRYCCAIYYLSGVNGTIIWSLGGSKSSFEMGGNTRFNFQHDARWITRNETYASISLFDNSGMSGLYTANTSRGLVLGLDFTTMKASFVREYIPYSYQVSESQGSVQVQENGNVLVGYE